MIKDQKSSRLGRKMLNSFPIKDIKEFDKLLSRLKFHVDQELLDYMVGYIITPEAE